MHTEWRGIIGKAMGSKVRGARSEEAHERFGLHCHRQNVEVVL